MIEWDLRLAEGPVGAARASILELGQSHVAVVAEASGPGAPEALTAALARLEGLRPGHRQAREPGFWCDALRELDRVLVGSGAELAAAVAAFTLGTLAGAGVGRVGAQLFEPEAFADLAAAVPRAPLLGSGDAAPAGFGPTPCRGTLVLASRALWERAGARSLWSWALREKVSEAAEGLASLVGDAVPGGSALVVVRAR